MKRRLTLVAVKDVGRRLAVQTLVSGTVMAGLNLAVTIDRPSLPWPLGGEMYVPADQRVASGPALHPAEDLGKGLASVAVVAGGKAERLTRLPEAVAAAPSVREATSPVIQPVASNDVVLFDQCMPGCESQDPLVAANRSLVAAAPAAPTSAPTGPLAQFISDAGQGMATTATTTGLLRSVSSRVVALGETGVRTLAGGLTSLTSW